MPKLSIVALALALAFTGATASPAQAKDFGGRLGIGLEQSIAGASGLTMRYFFNDLVGLHLLGGADITIPDVGDTRVGWVASGGVNLHVARSLHAHLAFGARLTVAKDPDKSAQVNVEIPLMLEFFLSDHFSFGASTGFLINLVPAGDTDADGTATAATSLDAPGYGGTTEPNATGIGVGAGSITGSLFIVYYF